MYEQINEISTFFRGFRVVWGSFWGPQIDKKGYFFEGCCPKGSPEGPGAAPGTILGVPGVARRCLGGPPGGSWGPPGDYFAPLGKPLGALRRPFEGAGDIPGSPRRLFRDFRLVFPCFPSLSFAFPHFPLLSPAFLCFPCFPLLSPCSPLLSFAFLGFCLQIVANSSKQEQLTANTSN